MAFLHTPFKKTNHHSQTRANIQTYSFEAEVIIRDEMRVSAFGYQDDFFEKFLPEKDLLIDEILDKMIAKGLLVDTAGSYHWTHIPQDPATEALLYDPFTETLNEIAEACGSKRTFDVVWKNTHSKKTASDFAVEYRPDIVGVLRTQEDPTNAAVWWRLVHIPIEVKKHGEETSALVQLLKYTRQALMEQVDRRFIYGFILAKRNVTVWHVDRSGAIGSKSFDIHTDARLLIRLIVSFTTNSDDELGWDPTIKVITDLNSYPLKAELSYKVPDQVSPYHRQWLVSMPETGGRSGRENFVMFTAHSLAKAEVIRGRATRIWKAWKMEDMKKAKADRDVRIFSLDSRFTLLIRLPRQIFIVKDTWRDDRRGLEGEIYDKIGLVSGVAVIHSYETVHLRMKADTTKHLIRRDLVPTGPPLNIATNQRRLRKDAMNEDAYLRPVSLVNEWEDWYEPATSGKPAVPQGRTHSRLVLESYGCLVEKFLSLEELMAVFHDAVLGHLNAYNAGILHRDVSSRNILITGLPKPDRGIIIDFDYSIKYKTHVPILEDERTGTLPYMSAELASSRHDPYEVGNDSFPKVTRHELVHDLESFFWVLCWICICRKGPGTHRFLTVNDSEECKEAVSNLFETESTRLNAMAKTQIMEKESRFGSDILKSFSPYFEPLADTIRALRNILREAYSTRKWDGLHQKFLAVLAKAEDDMTRLKWNDTDPEYKRMEEETRRWRDEHMGHIPPKQPPLKRKRTESTPGPSTAGKTSKKSRPRRRRRGAGSKKA
ncbi:hypothetical protein EW146_g7317 [Bondarzewia mesenterica]|uniref:Fungal-type protein kinase domain-containing protein n=1 Tax=Bondarzewia mesenterica TaxID=1095465 RepID=A0A4S4LL91_9AGAM|nr:hypothetical protein EW146_g7317 [Bondarzewia mesenterica]